MQRLLFEALSRCRWRGTGRQPCGGAETHRCALQSRLRSGEYSVLSLQSTLCICAIESGPARAEGHWASLQAFRWIQGQPPSPVALIATVPQLALARRDDLKAREECICIDGGGVSSARSARSA